MPKPQTAARIAALTVALLLAPRAFADISGDFVVTTGTTVDLTNITPTVNSLTWTGGAITAQGVIRDGDTVTGGQLTVQTTATLSGDLSLGGDFFVFNGTTTIGTAAPTTLSTTISSPTLFNTGSLTIGNQATLAGFVSLFNSGTADITAANNDVLAKLWVQNTGTVNLHSGTIATVESGTDTGTYNLDSGATLSVMSETFSATSSITGQGNVLDAYPDPLTPTAIRGTYNITGNTSVIAAAATLRFFANASTGSLTLLNGTIGGAGSMTVNDPLSWSGGTIGFAGGITLNGGQLAPTTLSPSNLPQYAHLGGSMLLTAGHTFTFATASQSATLYLFPSASLTSNGTWNAGIGVLSTDNNSTGTTTASFINNGTLTVNAPSSSFALEDGSSGPLAFTNTGLININAGELILAASGHPSLGGSIVVASGATLAIAANISLDGSISGDGNFLISNNFVDALGNSFPGLPPAVTFNGSVSLSGNTAIGNATVAFNTNTTLNNLAATSTTFSGPATLTIGGTSTWDDVNLTSAPVLVTGALTAKYLNTHILTLDAAALSIASTGTLTLSNANSVTLKNHASLINNGLLSLSTNSTAFIFSAAQFGSAQNPGGSFTNNGTITSSSSLAFSSSITFTNNGTINITHGSLQIPVSTDTANAVINIGTAASLLLNVRSFTTGTLNNAGSILLGPDTATVTLGSGLTFINTGTYNNRGLTLLAAAQNAATTGIFNVGPGSTLDFQSNYTFSTATDPTLTGSGLLIIDPGTTLSLAIDSAFSGDIQDNGTLLLTPARNPNSNITTPNFTILPATAPPAPEPATLTLLALTSPLLLRHRRRR